MKRRILTMFWYDDAGEVHLYKDVGGIPYALAKYCGWQATFAYNDVNCIIHNEDYEKYVKLDTIHYPKILCKLKLRYYKYFQVIKYVWDNADKYDVINFYHCHKFINFLCWLAKKKNPKIITYVKLDMSASGFTKECNSKKEIRWNNTDLFTVEAQKYVDTLNKLSKFNGKVKYLPNGFFSDLAEVDKNIHKEKIILTVGRLGTYQKNTEMLVDAFMQIEKNKLTDWRLYLVGPFTDEFRTWLHKKIEADLFFKDKIILTGNITEKSKLYKIYAKAGVFVLPSRYEGFPLVIQESLHFSCYPIITDCFAGADEVVKESYGSIVKNENLEKLKSAIEYAVNNYFECINKGIVAAKCIDKNFSWKVLAERLETYINK